MSGFKSGVTDYEAIRKRWAEVGNPPSSEPEPYRERPPEQVIASSPSTFVRCAKCTWATHCEAGKKCIQAVQATARAAKQTAPGVPQRYAACPSCKTPYSCGVAQQCRIEAVAAGKATDDPLDASTAYGRGPMMDALDDLRKWNALSPEERQVSAQWMEDHLVTRWNAQANARVAEYRRRWDKDAGIRTYTNE